jgi:hypothetical protein
MATYLNYLKQCKLLLEAYRKIDGSNPKIMERDCEVRQIILR